MTALEIVGGLLLFIPSFIWLGVKVGKAAEKGHTLIAFVLLYAGLAALILIVNLYGRLLR